jgi:hypothetical protein
VLHNAWDILIDTYSPKQINFNSLCFEVIIQEKISKNFFFNTPTYYFDFYYVIII